MSTHSKPVNAVKGKQGFQTVEKEAATTSAGLGTAAVGDETVEPSIQRVGPTRFSDEELLARIAAVRAEGAIDLTDELPTIPGRFDCLVKGDRIVHPTGVAEVISDEHEDTKDLFERPMKQVKARNVETGKIGYVMYGPDGMARRLRYDHQSA